MPLQPPPQQDIDHNVAQALAEDLGDGDITAGLIPAAAVATATIISRETAILCGRPWVDSTFRQLDDTIELEWHAQDGDALTPNQAFVTLRGNARALLTGERTALNFLQTLSGTATRCHHYAQRVAGTGVTLLDTRKTLPGLRTAQKYAVRCGGCHNHRMGLYDAFLIKENHIAACGGITAAVASARQQAPGKPVEVEVETLEQLKEAITAGADTVMLDNFSIEQMREGVALAAGRVKLEASGNVDDESVKQLAEIGLDYISIGTLTKNVTSVDLSMRIDRINLKDSP